MVKFMLWLRTLAIYAFFRPKLIFISLDMVELNAVSAIN